MNELSNKLKKKYKKLLKKHLPELLFLSLALISTIISSILYINTIKSTNDNILEIENKNFEELNTPKKKNMQKKIYVDISGAVLKPDVYIVSEGARLKDVLILAGGLSANADRKFFYRNFNLALPVFDGQKIYVPSYFETRTGIIREPKRTFDFTGYDVITYKETVKRILKDSQNFPSDKININSASKSQLESLPGIGPVTAQKIIDNRPYTSVEELLQKKILRKSVFENVKERLTL